MGAIIMQFVSDDKSFGSQAIEWFDHGQYSHVDSVMPDGSLLGARDDVYNGIPKGVQIRPSEYVAGKVTKRVLVPTTDPIAAAYYAFVTSQIGKPYDETAIAAFVFGRNWNEADSWFCSELNSAGLVASGFVHPLSAPANKIAPDDLLLILSVFVAI
jgi:hypothetical protein